MKYFTNCKSLEELRKEYKKLVKENHPDNNSIEQLKKCRRKRKRLEI